MNSAFTPVTVTPKALFTKSELFIRRTFVVRCKRKYDLLEEQAEQVFGAALNLGLIITYFKRVGLPPGTVVYFLNADGEVQTKKPKK